MLSHPLNQPEMALFDARGWLAFPWHAGTAAWAAHAASAAPAAMADPAQAHWFRHRRTWFVGVDALPNDGHGRLPGGPPLAGPGIDFLQHALGCRVPLHRAQLSVCFPGYPQQDDGETDAQHAFRKNRDAAHVDGLHGEGAAKRRHVREFHHAILGLPLNATPEGAAPFVVWEGSHKIMQAMFMENLAHLPVADWPGADLTEPYQAARRHCFETCRRTIIHCQPGESFIVHRLALHGVAPWAEGILAQNRMLAYFRPEMPDPRDWLSAL